MPHLSAASEVYFKDKCKPVQSAGDFCDGRIDLRTCIGYPPILKELLKGPGVNHTISEKQKLLNRVRRIRGQVEAIERALDGEAGCAQVMHQIAGCRGAINSLLVEVVEDHIRTHLVDPARNPDALDAEAAAQLIEVVHSYFR